MWITASFNAVVVAVMVLLPLVYPEALPGTFLTSTLSAPPPPAAAPRTVAAVTRPARVSARLDAYTAPARIPHTIDTARDDAPPPGLGTGVVGMVATDGGGIGPAGALGLGSAPPVAVVVAAPKPAAPVHISSGVIAGNKLSGSSPLYPPIARAAHVSGTVVLHAVISKAGSIQSLAVVSGPEMLRANAVAAVQDWRYRPYLLNGEPVEVDTTITVNFLFGG